MNAIPDPDAEREAAQEMYIAAIVGPDIDGVLAPPAEEFEQVQLDLAVPGIEPRFPPIE